MLIQMNYKANTSSEFSTEAFIVLNLHSQHIDLEFSWGVGLNSAARLALKFKLNCIIDIQICLLFSAHQIRK